LREGLPNNHGLPADVIDSPALMPKSDGQPSLTDAQFESLAAGVAMGRDVLVSAPTSTGKTLIGWWTIASCIARGGRAVYLVSHRALAKQKFEEAQRLFLSSHLNGDQSAIVCATGDSVEDASGRKTSSPLSASILIATYEKYLGCLSTGGPPRDLRDVTFVCDEVQLIGDKTRGKNVELLLTLVKRAGWRQFVGLSAVLSANDAASLADWLQLELVRCEAREKTLKISCLTNASETSITFAPGREGAFIANTGHYIVDHLRIISALTNEATRKPVIVFCMKVDDTFDLAGAFSRQHQASVDVPVPPGADISPDLIGLLRKRIAYHNAEISEEERVFVEQRLADGDVDVVFATSTLAAGVNFPLGSAVFASWKRWNSARRAHVPMSRAEFQNMAGRVGRMGQSAAEGAVILTAANQQEIQSARILMDFAAHDDLGVGIAPADFGPLVLQIFAGRLCTTRAEAFSLLSSTLSAARELERNQAGIDHWRETLDEQIDRLIGAGCLLEAQSGIVVTSLGLGVARSGLKPETAQYFFEGLHRYATRLVELLPDASGSDREDDLAFVLIHAALSSPEFNYSGGDPTRFINWRIGNPGLLTNPSASRLADILFEQPWIADVSAANGAIALTSWTAGSSREQVESLIPSVRLGTIQALARDAAWILTGISEIIATVTASALADEAKPAIMRGTGASVVAARQLARAMRRLAARINSGLPSDVLWMTSLELQNGPRRLSRAQILSLRQEGLIKPLALMSGDEAATSSRTRALNGSQRTSNAVRDAARRWKVDDREYCKIRHEKRASRFDAVAIVSALYDSRGDAFEAAFEAALGFAAISFQKLDGPGRVGYPDYLVTIEGAPGLVFELKTRQADTEFVSFNNATEVLSASELIGMKDNFCVTLCNPAFEPSVPGLIERCARLSVLEACDLAEALLRVREGSLTRADLHNWLSTPGVALREDLPSPY